MAYNSAKSILNGQLIDGSEPAISISSRGLMYGDGCFETFCSYGGRFFKLQEHLDRLRSGLEYLEIDFPDALSPEKLKAAIQDLLSANKVQNEKAIIRLQVWRAGGRGYATASKRSHYAIQCFNHQATSQPYTLARVGTKRIPSAALPSNYKLTNGINYIKAAKQAHLKGADDALMETMGGFISETTLANIFWVKNKKVYTPSQDCDILLGVTRQVVINLLQSMPDVRLKQGQFSADEIKAADAVWICNSVKEIMPVSSIDETDFSASHSLVQAVQAGFKSYLQANLEP